MVHPDLALITNVWILVPCQTSAVHAQIVLHLTTAQFVLVSQDTQEIQILAALQFNIVKVIINVRLVRLVTEESALPFVLIHGTALEISYASMVYVNRPAGIILPVPITSFV